MSETPKLPKNQREFNEEFWAIVDRQEEPAEEPSAEREAGEQQEERTFSPAELKEVAQGVRDEWKGEGFGPVDAFVDGEGHLTMISTFDEEVAAVDGLTPEQEKLTARGEVFRFLKGDEVRTVAIPHKYAGSREKSPNFNGYNHYHGDGIVTAPSDRLLFDLSEAGDDLPEDLQWVKDTFGDSLSIDGTTNELVSGSLGIMGGRYEIPQPERPVSEPKQIPVRDTWAYRDAERDARYIENLANARAESAVVNSNSVRSWTRRGRKKIHEKAYREVVNNPQYHLAERDKRNRVA